MSMPHRTPEMAHTARGRHTSINQFGELCMTVVDPVSRKLLIPVQHVYRTRAQQRNTLPSLCLLFLNRRCRQAGECYQVHANRDVVQLLRSEIDSLPCCCVAHGDADRTADADHPREPTVVYLPGCKPSTFNGGYVPIQYLSYTVALRRLLQGRATTAEAAPGQNVLDASGCTICRLHALDRCRYAEECKFLHVCKDITEANPELITPGAPETTDVTTEPHSTEKEPSHAGANPAVATQQDEGGANAQNEHRGVSSNNNSGAGGHVSVFTTVTRRQQQHQDALRRGAKLPTATSSLPTPVSGVFPYGGYSGTQTGTNTPAPHLHTADFAAYCGSRHGTWLAPQGPQSTPRPYPSAPPQAPPTNQLYSMPHIMSGSFGAPAGAMSGPCSSFQDGALMMASSIPAYMQGMEGSYSLSTLGYSNASAQPVSPATWTTAGVSGNAGSTPSGSRKPLLVPLGDGNSNPTGNVSKTAAAPNTAAATTASMGTGAHPAGSLGYDVLTPGGDVDAPTHSSDSEGRSSPYGDTTRRRDARDPSRWSYNPYGSSLVSL